METLIALPFDSAQGALRVRNKNRIKKMNKKIVRITLMLTLLVGFFYAESILAQNKMLSLYDAVLNPNLRAERLRQSGWIPDSKTAFYVYTENPNTLIFFDAEKNKLDSNAFKFNDFVKAAEGAKMTMKNLPSIKFVSATDFTFESKGVRYQYSIANKLISEIISFPASEAQEYHEQQNNLAYVSNDNLFVKKGNAVAKQLTNDGGKGIVYGQAVHRSEFGITNGLFWSEKGNKLAFYRMDETMVTEYPIYQLGDTPATVRMIRYPVAGAKSHHVTVGLYDVAQNKTIYLKTGGNPEDYLTNISWSEDEKTVYLARVNRAQNQMDFEEYNAESGSLIKVIFTEKSETYTEPEHNAILRKGDKDCFYWLSERDGFNHIYLYKKGKLEKQITKGNYTVTDVLGQDKKYIYFMSTKDGDLEQNLYKVSLDGGDVIRITKTIGTHNCNANSDFSYFIDDYSNYTEANISQVIDNMGSVKKNLLQAQNPLKNYLLGETKVFELNNGSAKLYARIILPPNFDKTKKYPVITYVYGGPHVQLVSNRFLAGSNYWMQYMAQQGYIVFTVDNRGSFNRGQSFEGSIHRNVGDNELSDQMVGVQYLKSLPYVDSARMGLHGWSFGGFMTTSLMTRYPHAYKVGVAGGPVIDWKFYEIMYTERYMDLPEENKAGYEKNNLLNYIDSLQGRLLMIHGTEDDVVLWQHSLLYVKAAVDANNLNLDYFVYPGHPHNVRGKDRLHLMGKITQYFQDHL